MSASSPDFSQQQGPTKRRSIEELARQQGVRPIKSVDDLAQDGIFESDEELGEFLAELYAFRRAGL